MQVFIFQSEKDKDIFGFSGELAGGNLPAEFAPWQRIGNTALQSGGGVAGIGPADAVIASIEREGFFVARSEGVQVSRQLPSRPPH